MNADQEQRIRQWSKYLRDSGMQLYRVVGGAAKLDRDRPVTDPRPPAEATPINISAPPPAQSNDTVESLNTDDIATRAAESLDDIRAEMGDCQRCLLGRTRTKLVFGEGNSRATLMFVGEGPGADEDQTGRPFVGKAGQLLDKMIGAMGLLRTDVYIANIVKSRPPGNRDPQPDEVAACLPFLLRQIQAIQPQVIVTLGKPAARHLLGLEGAISKYRGTWQSLDGIAVMPTWHPAYLLRNPAAKADAWADLQQVMHKLGLKPPSQ